MCKLRLETDGRHTALSVASKRLCHYVGLLLGLKISCIRPCSYPILVSGELIEEEENYEAQVDTEETSDHLEEVKALEIEGTTLSRTCFLHELRHRGGEIIIYIRERCYGRHSITVLA